VTSFKGPKSLILNGLAQIPLLDRISGQYGVMDAAAHGIGGGIGTSPKGGAGHVTFFMEVDDLEATLREAERLGGKTIATPATFPDRRPSARGKGSVTFAYFADPEGHVVGLCKGIVRP
jgi:predicted enzyme related to lactoylglutathione lyase